MEMKSKPYRIIFFLLAVSLFSILLLQGIWLRNLYLQKVEEFDKSIYSNLAEIGETLNERQSIKLISETIEGDSVNSRTIIKKYYVKGKGNNVESHIKVKSISKGASLDINTLEVQSGSDQTMIIDSDSNTILLRPDIKAMALIDNDNDTIDVGVNNLMKKMILELKDLDASYINKINSDTLHNIIQRQLESKGIFIPFEFSLIQYKKSKVEVVARSRSYDPNAKAFESDLSSKKLFGTHYILYLQFPNTISFVFSKMKQVLILMGLFSLLILCAFYYTLKIILDQKKISEIKNDFINNMTHELKTPIATISLAIDAINNPTVKNDNEKFSNYSRILKEENQKLNMHVERVLQMALLDKGELHLKKEELNLNSLLTKVISNYTLQIEKYKAQVVLHAEQDIFFTGDELHLLSVFSNLLDNALKYSKADCKIDIRLYKDLHQTIIIFKDNGIGIDADLKEKVFEKFYRAQGGNLHDVKGFGLGLSYVRSIIQAHGGTIELKSEKGKGSEFMIILPNG
jgi:two-component system phosphate regulon sensor histidine kinase PhoR